MCCRSASTMKAPLHVQHDEHKKHEIDLMPGDQYILVMAFSPDGQLLLTVSANEDHSIRELHIYSRILRTMLLL